MSTKSLISALALTLALGTQALPDTVLAKGYDRDGHYYPDRIIRIEPRWYAVPSGKICRHTC